MDLKVHYENEFIKHISVMGEIEHKDVEKLIAIMNEDISAEIRITFFDVGVVHYEIVEKLFWLQKYRKCRVYVLKRYLYSYLNNLGIKCEYAANKYIENPAYTSKSIMDRGVSDSSSTMDFLNSIREKYGYDYTQYQIESIIRRIKISMLRENLYDFEKFKDIVLNNPQVFEQLFLDFSINTTDFFRDPEVFLNIRDKVIPYLKFYPYIKIWCAGSSTGKEPYSLAILLHEHGILHKTYIYGTDINPYVIEEAKNGLFSTESIEKDMVNYKKAGGKEKFEGYFITQGSYMRIRNGIKKNILFFQHSLVGSGILNEFQMIVCRNVFIYFNKDLQRRILENFYNSLDKNGFLVLGKSEGMLQNGGYDYFNKYIESSKIYKRK